MLARLLAQAIRIHQWPKNLLVFLPALASQKFGEVSLFGASLVAFVAFCLTTSAVYLINDVVDLKTDRNHPAKRLRPFASGALSTTWCYFLAPTLLILAVLIALRLGWSFLAVLGCYTLLALAYSAGLKRILVLDVVVIALLFGLRVIAGYAATGLDYSVWLLSFTQFLFFSLALMKRDIELPSPPRLMPFGAHRNIRELSMPSRSTLKTKPASMPSIGRPTIFIRRRKKPVT
jgi:4-hydroxybenzoate polyprenyltransferase